MDKTKKNFSLQIISQKMHIYLVSESSQRAVSPASLQSEDLEGRGDDHLLLFVIGRRNSLEGLQPLKGILSALSLVGGHATDLRLKDDQVLKVNSLNQQVVQCARRSWREP